MKDEGLREKAIKGLECCILRGPDDHARCSQCPYESNCVNRLKMDALNLLKEQEPKPQRYKEHDIFHLPFCPNTVCNAVLDKYWHYCPYCGTKFYWDEELDEQQKGASADA